MLTLKSRIESLLETSIIGVSISEVSNFELKELADVSVDCYPEISNLRLGKYIERVFSLLIKYSSNYTILKENIQIIADKITIGEFDFIIQNKQTQQVSHLELVYKFYLFDDNTTGNELEKWIGPNKKDTLVKKLDKLKAKQFPLLYQIEAAEFLSGITIKNIDQKLCFMASLFVPFAMLGEKFQRINNNAIVGYWVNWRDFKNQIGSHKKYYLPSKREWGIAPHFNDRWFLYQEIEIQLNDALIRHFSPLCWIKLADNSYEQCFIVWW